MESQTYLSCLKSEVMEGHLLLRIYKAEMVSVPF